jgi:hypothetical protein
MLKRFLYRFASVLAGLLVACGSLRAEMTNAAPDFKQVYELLRANLGGMSDEQLNSAAVEGLLKELHGRATLVGGSANRAPSQNEPGLIQSAVLENNVAYLRVVQVGSGLADQLAAAYHGLASTNKIAGTALDLRFADGNDYAVAVAVANLFMTKKMPLLKWDHEVEESRPAKAPIPGPLMILINGETRGAAEALAAALREASAGLILGNPTAGLAMTTRDFPLNNGQWLRIAANPVELGNGAAISRLRPDITVTVSLDDERAFLKNPYRTLAPNWNSLAMDTNDFLGFVDHTSEADLVRQKLDDGEDSGAATPPPGKGPQKPVIQDPVLARAVDLIKGLAIVRHQS